MKLALGISHSIFYYLNSFSYLRKINMFTWICTHLREHVTLGFYFYVMQIFVSLSPHHYFCHHACYQLIPNQTIPNQYVSIFFHKYYINKFTKITAAIRFSMCWITIYNGFILSLFYFIQISSFVCLFKSFIWRSTIEIKFVYRFKLSLRTLLDQWKKIFKRNYDLWNFYAK